MPFIQYQVDAFTSQLFKGNPAAVLLLDAFLPDALMQSIALENNLSETVFIVPRGPAGHYNLRWFTPTTEIEFCGHATLAAAHVLWTELDAPRAQSGAYEFEGQIGALSVTQTPERLYCLDAPVATPKSTAISPALKAAFSGLTLTDSFIAGPNLYAVCQHAQAIATHRPDFGAITPLSGHGVGLTAPNFTLGDQRYDFVSRFFVPAGGIDEDPVTGSAHTALGPYWGRVLGITDMRAYQASPRGGEVQLSLSGDRVVVMGPAVTFMRAEIFLP